jgi:20S proteasome alpha/beta subunit
MTLIVGFKCGPSVVLCADSQETRGSFKVEVDKLPIHSGGMDVVCGGAGR